MYLFRQHASRATCQGLLSCVTVLKELEWIRPVVARWHRIMCKGPTRLPEDNWAHGSFEVLAFYDKGCMGAANWTMYGIVVLSFTGFLQVCESITVRRGGLRHAFFYFRDAKTKGRVFGREMGDFCRAWAQ